MSQDLSTDVKRFFDRKRPKNSYDIQEEILKYVVKMYPKHINYAEVDVKVKLLNLFYSTGIEAIDKVTERIMSIKDIDSILNREAHSKYLVDEISKLELKNGKTRTNYSFATKYCAMHQPKKYPIFDSIVSKVLTKLFIDNKLHPYVYTRKKNKGIYEMTKKDFEFELRNYDSFVQIYKIFMHNFGLTHFSYRHVDWYIWGSYKDGKYTSEIEKIAPLNEGADYSIIKQ